MNETNVKKFADITLSNRRIVQRGKIGSVKSLSSFPLSSYASSKMESVSKPYFIALSAICLIGAVYALLSASNISLKMFHSADSILKIENIAVFGLLIIFSILFILLFVKTLTAKITIESTGGQTISAEVSGKQGSIEEFVDAIDEQVYLFLKSMNNTDNDKVEPQPEPIIAKFKPAVLSEPGPEIAAPPSTNSKE